MVRFAFVCALTAGCGDCGKGGHGPDASNGDGASPDSSGGSSLLHVSPNKRFLMDASNRPFYVVGDTAWCLVPGLTVAEATSYFQTRAGEGFNAVLMDSVVQLGASPVGAP